MPLSNSIMAYEDIKAYFEKALTSEKGLMLTFNTKGMAVHFRQRGYKFRALDRIRNTELYPEGDTMYGKSPYDILKIDLVENIAYIKRYDVADLSIEVKEIE